MKCPYCHNIDTVVKDTRTNNDSTTIKRRRLCEKCGKRFSTYERIESFPLMVVKKDNTRQPFERKKIEKGLLRACHKRPVSTEDIEKRMDFIEQRIYNLDLKGREIKSTQIGAIVLEELFKLDDVAFIRFASIYNDFDNIETFRKELDRLCKRK